MSNLTGQKVHNKIHGVGRIKWAFRNRVFGELVFVCQFRTGVHTVAASQCIML